MWEAAWFQVGKPVFLPKIRRPFVSWEMNRFDIHMIVLTSLSAGSSRFLFDKHAAAGRRGWAGPNWLFSDAFLNSLESNYGNTMGRTHARP